MSNFLKYSTVITLLLFCQFTLFSQESRKDSLKNILNSATEDSVKINVLLELAKKDNFSDREESNVYYQKLLKFDIETNQRAEYLYQIGYNNWQLGNYEEAIIEYQKALNLFTELNDSLLLAKVYNNIAVSNWGMGDNIEALQNYQKSLKIREGINDKKGESIVLNNIGKIYQDIDLVDDAFKMHQKALQRSFESKDTAAISYSYANIGYCYQHMGKLDSALYQLKTGYCYLQEMDPRNRSNSYFSASIGSIFEQKNMLDSALFYNKSALDFAIRIKNQNRVAIANYNLGKTYLANKQTDLASESFRKSQTIAEQKGYSVLAKDNLFALAQIEEEKGNINQAFEYYKRASQLNDSIFNQEVLAKISNVQIQYLTEQQNQENILLRKDNEIKEITIKEQKRKERLLLISGVLILIVLFFITRSRASFKRLNKQLEESEKNLLQANADKDKFFTIIAHDLKSPFNGLIGTIELLETNHHNFSQKETKELLGLIQKSAANVYSLLDSLLMWAQTQTGRMSYNPEHFEIKDTGSVVIDFLNSTALIKNILLQNKIPEQTSVFADPKVVSTILQNLVSNAIKFSHPGGQITIQAQEQETHTVISVHDTGVGIRKNILEKLFLITEKVSEMGTANEHGTGLGLILCKELVEKSGGVIWVNSEPGKGSTFSFSLPQKKGSVA
jgi:signal transduction histidine kinase